MTAPQFVSEWAFLTFCCSLPDFVRWVYSKHPVARFLKWQRRRFWLDIQISAARYGTGCWVLWKNGEHKAHDGYGLEIAG